MYILTSKYFPLDYWPDLYFPALPDVAVDIQYTEVMEFAVCIATSAGFSVVLPNEVDAVTGTMVVSGAGSTEHNGTYAETGTKNGYPRYIKPYANPRGGLFIVSLKGYGAYTWVISVAGLDDDQNFQILIGARYYSEDDVATPDLVTNWIQSSIYALPLPTVTPHFQLSVTASFTLVMPMIIDFELYEELSA